MSKKKKKKPNKAKRDTPKELQEAAESRTAVAANVAWMLSLLSTIAAEVIGLVCRWYTVLVEPVDILTVLSGVMLFVALIAGVVTLGMIPLVLKFNKKRPPSGLIRIALVAGSLPMVALALQQFVPR